MQFVLIAYDGTDEGALGRRMAVRESHLKLGKEMHDAGKWLYAAGILDDAGKMIGSMIVCEFASREADGKRMAQPRALHRRQGVAEDRLFTARRRRRSAGQNRNKW